MNNKSRRLTNAGTNGSQARPEKKGLIPHSPHSEIPGIFGRKSAISIKGYQIPELNLNAACTSGLWEICKHPNFKIMSPMPNEKNAEILVKLINHVFAGHVFMEEEVLHGDASYDGKPVTLAFMLFGSKSDSEFSVHFCDENGKYIGFPTQEQIDWVGKQ